MRESAARSAMVVREVGTGNLIESLSINPERIGDELVGRERAIQMWRKLIRSPAWTGAIVEASGLALGARIAGFGCDVFVTDDFVDAEISNPRPGLNSRVIASMDGGQPVVLSEREIRRRNTHGGLDIAILYGSWNPGLGSDEFSEVRHALAARFVELREGYRINRLITETIGEAETRQFLATHAWREVGRFNTPAVQSRSVLVMTREDADAVTASLANTLFSYRKPVLRLRGADQKLLEAALGGLTDEELSRKLGLSLAAVKKRWISIFERTTHSHPELFPAVDRESGDQRRSRQKRHHVLAYLREHREELRPTEL